MKKRIEKKDEAICLGTLLDADLSVIIQHKGAVNCTHSLLRQQMYIPKAMIFSNAVRMTKEGFRWALVSLMQRTRIDMILPAMVRDNEYGVLTRYGLPLMAPGWMCPETSQDQTFWFGYVKKGWKIAIICIDTADGQPD